MFFTLCASALAVAALIASFLLYRQKAALSAGLASANERERRDRRLLQERSDELAAVSAELERLSYSVSHDLSEPLRVVDGYANMIEEGHGGQLDANARRLLRVLRSSTQQMSQMIEDLLAFSRVGRRRPEKKRLVLGGLVNRVIAEQLMTYANRAVEFSVGELDAVEADAELLKQALAHLVGNAVKYTRGRYPGRVEIGRLPPESPGGASIYYVKDNGVGFDMRQSHRLFGIFQRFHTAQEFEGSGVGLAVVDRIVVAHGGRIWAESRPGEGAVFYFTLRPDSDKDSGIQSAAA